MVCLQTTHCAILLSLLGDGRGRLTEYSAPQWGQKKVPPSGIGSDRGTSAPPYSPNQHAPKREQIPAPSSPPRHQPTIIDAISGSIVSKRKDLALSAGEIAALAEVRNSNASAVRREA